MADNEGQQTSPAKSCADKTETTMELPQTTPEKDQESFSRPGAQLSDKQTFTNKNGETISGYPVIVDFRRLLQLTSGIAPSIALDFGMIPGISNRDLLHAVIGLYDVSLSEMTPDVLYSTVCEKWARTILLVRDLQETISDLEERKKKEPKEKEEDIEDEEAETSEAGGAGSIKESDSGSIDEDVYEAEEESPSKFNEVYSDSESEGEEEDDDDDEEDFSKGINTFINAVVERRKARKSCEGPITESMIGIENRIIGCATFEKKYVKHKDKVVHLTLVSVRKRCRSYGIGKYLLSQVVDPKVVGNYDAVVVHADNEAVEFFQKFGFSDDIVLNSRWRELAEQFTNCTLMCYLPGFSGHRLLSSIKVPGLEMYELEQEFLKWKEKTLEVYQQQVTCMMRMKHEVLQLKCTTTAQDKFLKALVEDNEKLKMDKMIAEKELLDYRLMTAKSTFGKESPEKADDLSTKELIDSLQREVNKMDLKLKHKRNSSKDLLEALNSKPNGSFTVIGGSRYMAFSRPDDRHTMKDPFDDEDSAFSKDVVSTELSKHFLRNAMTDRYRTISDESRYMAFSQTDDHHSTEEPYDHIKDSAFFYDVTEQFKQQMRMDAVTCTKCEVSTISKALVPESVKKTYRERVQSLHDPVMVLELYYCGTLEHPHRSKDILKNGFSERDFSCGEYGRGLYFSKFPSRAAQFSALGSLLKAEVGLGNVETVVKEDRTRAGPSPGFDSIITPGRLNHMLGQGDATMNQEYVIFSPTQALPLCLLAYETS